jgi:hypothetical protein
VNHAEEPGNIHKKAESILRINGSIAKGKPHSRLPDQAEQQYFSDHYPDSLFSLTGSTSDEVHQSPSSSSGLKAQGHASSSPSPTSHVSPRISTPTMTYIPDLEMDNNDNAKNAVDQLWPKLQQLIEPFGLHRDKELGDKDKNIEHVRQDADDLRDPEEDVQKAHEEKKK